MRFIYVPKTNYEKFGWEVYNLLVENSSKTFFVGGMVRDLLLKRKITDIDIATDLLPDVVIKLLETRLIPYSSAGKQFGIVAAKKKNFSVEIATLRSELYPDSRYPKVAFIKDTKKDSQRRDFTVNALYLQAKKGILIDFHSGKKDLENKVIQFIGKPEERLQEDPLRILRAIRFSVDLDFKIEKKSLVALKDNAQELKNISANRKKIEIAKAKKQKTKKILKKVINKPNSLDKYFE